MPTFCRHNRLVANCPICAREQSVELRPIVSSGTPGVSEPRPRTQSSGTRSRSGSGGGRAAAGVRVRRLARGADDGYSSRLVQGIRSSADAERLAEELAFAAIRLERLEADPPGLYAEVAAPGDLEERSWLAFLIAYLSPLNAEDPFASIREVRTSWTSGLNPELSDIETGPRSAHDPSRGARTLDAYRAWAQRAGSQEAAFSGGLSWTAERRFARVYERLALPGLHRDARFDLLVTLGRLGVYELRAGGLMFGGENEATVAAKRALGIGDPLLLERRAGELAAAAQIQLEAIDAGLHNWGRGERATLGIALDTELDERTLEPIRAALGLS